ncbi:MAG: tryptophan--tRNA ligase [Patescibacteria group bacterium]|nr:tryptophan--tRNA ligase [Patescibacteria group bacterium]
MKFLISKKVRNKFPDVDVVLLPVKEIIVQKGKNVLIEDKLEFKIEEVRTEEFFNSRMFTLYRDFYKELGFDPETNIPSVERLYRRYLESGKFPRINNVVDVTNLVALQTFIPLGVFDANSITGDIVLRFSEEGEEFKPLGGGVEYLPAGLVVMADNEKILSRFFYRDSVYQKIDEATTSVFILGCKVKGVDTIEVRRAVEEVGNNLKGLYGGGIGHFIESEVVNNQPSVSNTTIRNSDRKMLEKITKKLDSYKIKYKVLNSGTDSLNLDEQVRALGMKYREGLGTLLFKGDGKRYIALLRRDDRSVDNVRLKQVLKLENVEMCSPDEVKKLGFKEGLLTPFLLDDKVELYADDAVMYMDRVITGSATRSGAIETDKENIMKFLGSRKYKVIDVTFPNPHRQDADNIKVETVLSGITPSGNALHIGNYFGAVKPQMDLQVSVKNSFYFVADLHALTTVQDKKKLEENITSNILDFIALGLDPNKSAYFRQSDVPAHSQLAVVLANYIPFGYLKRMHAFKDKLAKGVSAETINMGLFNYPILMAADILLYKPDGVPVGEDQRQHVELARDVAQSFNKVYPDNFFPLPEPLISSGHSGKVVGTDGERKMSKSLGNVIGIFDDEKLIKEQITKCFTDPNRKRASDPGTVEGNPVFIYHDLLNDNKDEVNDLKKRYREGKVGDVEVKEKLVKAHKRCFEEARKKRKEIEGNIKLAKDILEKGAERANEYANKALDEVYDLIGIENELSFRKR